MRVLIAGTNRACHQRLLAAGHELVLFIPRDKLAPADTTERYQHVVVLDHSASLGLCVELAAALHREQPFGAVAAFNEGTYEMVHAISAALQVPCVIDPALFERVRDKSTTRAVLATAGIPNCRYAQARGRADIERAIELVGLPCIVKPVDAEGSLSVLRIDAEDAVDAALDQLSPDRLAGRMLVEELLIGEELSVEGLSVGTRHHVVAITKKFVNERNFVESGHLVPAPVSAADQNAIVSYVISVLDALGFHDCPSHTEIMLTAEGPRLIETHNRIGGDRIMDLVEHAHGVDMYDLVARQAIGEPVDRLLPESAEATQSAAVWFADPVVGPELTLTAVLGLERAREMTGVTCVDLVKPLGSRQGAERASSERTALAVAVGPTPQQAVASAWTAAGALSFEYLWDPSTRPEAPVLGP
jgi:biotin carboxylase